MSGTADVFLIVQDCLKWQGPSGIVDPCLQQLRPVLDLLRAVRNFVRGRGGGEGRGEGPDCPPELMIGV